MGLSPARARTRALYDRLSRFYDLLAEGSEQPVRRRALELLAARPGERILEVGPGTGHALAAIASAGARPVGVDLSGKMLARARRVLARQEDEGELVCGDAASLPFPDAVFDGAFSTFTLELFDDSEALRVLAEMRRVLRPGGRLALAAMCEDPARGAASRLYAWSHRRFPHFVDCRPIPVCTWVEDAGFAVEEAERIETVLPVEIVRARRPA